MALINLAADVGADAAKLQHFKAETIVSDEGFKNLSGQLFHQSKREKSVFEVYQK
jgi:sialic acid synthase SpsE